jgi:hypothetical protein
VSAGCCNESGCRRKTPILLRKGPFSGAWYAVTHYTQLKDHPGTVRTADGGKHDVTKDVALIIIGARAQMLDEVADMIAIELSKLDTPSEALRPGLELARSFVAQLADEQGADLRV